MTDQEIKKQKIREIEDILYQWKYFEHIESNFNLKIEELENEIIDAREKYPQPLKERYGKSNEISKTTENTAISIIDGLSKKIERLKREKDEALVCYYTIKKAFNKLSGDEKEMIRCKYFEKQRGEFLYKKLNYSRSGFYKKKMRILMNISDAFHFTNL